MERFKVNMPSHSILLQIFFWCSLLSKYIWEVVASKRSRLLSAALQALRSGGGLRTALQRTSGTSAPTPQLERLCSDNREGNRPKPQQGQEWMSSLFVQEQQLHLPGICAESGALSSQAEFVTGHKALSPSPLLKSGFICKALTLFSCLKFLSCFLFFFFISAIKNVSFLLVAWQQTVPWLCCVKQTLGCCPSRRVTALPSGHLRNWGRGSLWCFNRYYCQKQWLLAAGSNGPITCLNSCAKAIPWFSCLNGFGKKAWKGGVRRPGLRCASQRPRLLWPEGRSCSAEKQRTVTKTPLEIQSSFHKL